MATPVIMPKQGQSVESCIISQWFKKKGDSVKAGEPLFSYETDKASFEEEAKTDGVLLDIFFGEGDEVPVLTNIAVIGDASELADEFSPDKSAPAPAATPAEIPTAAPSIIETAASSTEAKRRGRPAEIDPTAETEVALAMPKRRGRPAKIKEIAADIATPIQTVADTAADGKIRVSPRARAIADKKGIDLANVKGTGPNGRIISRDVENIVSAPPMPQIQVNTTAAPVPEPSKPAAAYSDAECEVKKLTNIRKLIARAMHESLQNSAQLTHHMSADVRKLLALRKVVKNTQKANPNSPNITLNDMVCWAVVRALEKFPEANSQFLGDSIKTFKQVHLGLAVDTPRGLMVPVLKNADELSLKGLSNKLRALADSCRKGNIDPELLQSAAGSFTVSNLGNYGVEMFTPIINIPQVAILGVNTIVHRPADIGDGTIAFVPHIGLSLTYDHRAIDGGPATLFLKEIALQIEKFSVEF